MIITQEKADIFNSMFTLIHKQNVEMGWWDEPRTLKKLLMLTVTELSEAMDGFRKNLMDEHLPHRKMLEVELADAVIRLFDTAKYYYKDRSIFIHTEDINYYTAIPIVDAKAPNALADDADDLFDMVDILINCEYVFSRNLPPVRVISLFVGRALSICQCNGFDLIATMYEKIEYNKTRADHQRINRNTANGKKF